MNRPYASSSDDFDPYATGPHPSAGDVDREYGEGRWYLAGDPTPASGVNPRVDRSSPLGTPHAFVSLPLSLDRPDNVGTPPAATTPTAPTAPRPRIDRPAPDKTDDGPGSGIAVIERGERLPGGKSRLSGVRRSTYARALQDARAEQAARSARLAEERMALERAAIERAAAEQAAIERAAAERAAAERAAAARAAADRAAADREAVERAMNAAARANRPSNDSRAPAALPTVAAAAGGTNEPIRSMPTVRPIPGTGPLTLLSLAGADQTESSKSSRTFRLDHGDWMPTPHNPQLFVTPAASTQAVDPNRTPLASSDSTAHAGASIDAMNESRPHEPMTSRVAQAEASPILVAPHGDLRGAEHHSSVSPAATAANATKAHGAIAPRPAWEVDDFRWPTLTTELLLSQGTIFDRLLKALRERNVSAKVLGITGSRSGDGRSTLAICLARWSASQGHRTLLVDGDLLRGSLATAAGVDFDRGWSDLEGQGLPVGEGLIRSAATPLTLLPLDPRRLDEGEHHRTARRLDALLAELRPHFDWIMVDSGTAEELARYHLDAIPSLDAAVVVRNLQVTTPQELEAAQRHLVGIGIRQLAVAENFGRRKAG